MQTKPTFIVQFINSSSILRPKLVISLLCKNLLPNKLFNSTKDKNLKFKSERRALISQCTSKTVQALYWRAELILAFRNFLSSASSNSIIERTMIISNSIKTDDYWRIELVNLNKYKHMLFSFSPN